MIHLYLVRHGECEGQGLYIGRGSDKPLTEDGKNQILLLSEKLSDELDTDKIDLLYSSTLIRAIESASIVSNSLGVPTTEDNSLEETDFGDWESLSYEYLNNTWPEDLKKWIEDPINNKPPNGETLNDLKKRILPFYLNMVEMANDKKEWNIIVVSHKGPLTILVTLFLKLGLDYFWNFKIDRGSLTKLNLYPRFNELEYLNFKS